VKNFTNVKGKLTELKKAKYNKLQSRSDTVQRAHMQNLVSSSCCHILFTFLCCRRENREPKGHRLSSNFLTVLLDYSSETAQGNDINY